MPYEDVALGTSMVYSTCTEPGYTRLSIYSLQFLSSWDLSCKYMQSSPITDSTHKLAQEQKCNEGGCQWGNLRNPGETQGEPPGLQGPSLPKVEAPRGLAA